MPASRSRTERWYDCLQQIAARRGSIEIAIDQQDREDNRGQDLVWRVRLIRVGEEGVLVESPTALGARIAIEPGTPLIASMSIGQNRWMFHTSAITEHESSGGVAIELGLPDKVERCSRRSFERITTASLNLPLVRCWALLDPATSLGAEAACRVRMREAQRGVVGTELVLPEVGPGFEARLTNIGGGGIGIRLDPSEASSAESTRFYWLSVDLTPSLPMPLSMTARMVHKHLDSTQHVHAGMAFDFSLNPEHRDFVIEQILKFTRSLRSAA